MLRRDFLKVPALGLLIPTVTASGGTSRESGGAEPEGTRSSGPSQRLHQDFETYTPGIEHYYLGNGEIQAVIQHCPDRSGQHPQTFVGLTLMDAERFARKWSTLLFHPERGLERSAITIQSGEKRFQLSPSNMVSIGWVYPEGVPTVGLVWKAGTITVTEEFVVPSEGALLYRTVRLQSAEPLASEPTVHIQLVPSFAIFDEISTDPTQARAVARGYTMLQLYAIESGAEASGRYDLHVPAPPGTDAREHRVRFVYSMGNHPPERSADAHGRIWAATVEYWKAKTLVQTGNETLDHLYAVSRTCAKAGVARNGKRDSGIWMYNMEWIRDDLFTAMAMLHTGFHQEAKTIFTHILENSIGEDGCAMESSRWSGPEYTELDQNGEILYALWSYLCWSGDEEFLRRYWPRIVTIGDFPLQKVFRDPATGLLHNKREFWERSDAFGVLEGFELMHQYWVALGLEKMAEVAQLFGDSDTTRRWSSIAREMHRSMLAHSTFRFIEDGHLIKRRTLDGAWQRQMIPRARGGMPPGSPIATEATPLCEPDTSSLYPLIYGLSGLTTDVSRKTLEGMEELWNQRWSMGGYSRYNVTSEPDLPGPWPITTALVARAAIECGDSPRAWRALNWIRKVHGGESGWWFERYAPSITPPAPPVSVCGWIWPELILLTVHNLMGVRPGLDYLEIRPRLIDGLDSVSGRFRIRSSDISLTLERTGALEAFVDGKEVPVQNGSLKITYPKPGSTIEVMSRI